MKIAFTVHTPGQAYFWASICNLLVSQGHQAFVLCRANKLTEKILSQQAIKYVTYGNGSKTTYGKVLHLPAQFLRSFRFISAFHPDIIAGASILESHTAAILRKPCIIFEDTEITPSLERIQWQTTASCIVTPVCFKLDLGKKQIRIDGYKELAYLHPNYFKPDPTIFAELKIQRDEKYAIVRFNSFNAVHDIGLRGLSLEEKYTIVKELGKYVKVFISAEGDIPADLADHKLNISPHRIHHVLYYAQMVMGDSGTMASESAVLGTPAIRCNAGLGQYELGNFTELEKKYGLVYCVERLDDVLPRALELIQDPELKQEWAVKRQKMLSEKIDVTRFMADLIENYPRNLKN